MRLLHRTALGATLFGLMNFIIAPIAEYPEVAKFLGIFFVAVGIACFICIPENSKEENMTITEFEQNLREMQSSHDAEVKARLELLRKIHCPPHVVVDFEQSIEAMEKKNEAP